MNNKGLFTIVILMLLVEEAVLALKFPSVRRLLSSLKSTLGKPLLSEQTLKTRRPPLIVEPPLDAAGYTSAPTVPRVLFVLGGPGAGKGTQCTKLSNEFKMTHISAGDLLREEMASGSPLGDLISSYIKEGTIVPVHVTIELLRAKIFENAASCNRFLIDGFPRNYDNLQGWNERMKDAVDLEGVIFIDCPQEEMEKRLLERGLTSGRTDDNIETARKRFATYHAATMPVVNYFEQEQKLLRIGGHQSVTTVYDDLKQSILPLIENEIIQLTNNLEESIQRHDWNVYQSLCEINAEMRFHNLLFDFNDALPITPSTLGHSSPISIVQSPIVVITGTTAKISYSKHGRITREWQLIKGQWKMTSYNKQ